LHTCGVDDRDGGGGGVVVVAEGEEEVNNCLLVSVLVEFLVSIKGLCRMGLDVMRVEPDDVGEILRLLLSLLLLSICFEP